MRIKVVSLNMWLGERIDEMVEFFEEEQPDVVLAQEVTRGFDGKLNHGIGNVLERLVSEFGWNGEFVHMWRASQPAPVEMGVAVFSPWEIEKRLSGYYFKEPQDVDEIVIGIPGRLRFCGALAGVKIDFGEVGLSFYSTHFVWSKHPEISEDQWQAAEGLINRLSGEREFLLGGDFNLTNDSEVFEKIQGELGVVNDRNPDVDNTLHPSIHRLKGSKRLAVDFVLRQGEGLRMIDSSVPEVPVSDHLPVVVEYDI